MACAAAHEPVARTAWASCRAACPSPRATLSHRIGWIIGGGTQGQLDLAYPELVGDVTCVGNRSGQPVELGHDQRVAAAHRGKRLVETGTRASAPGQPVVGVDAPGIHPELHQGAALRGEVLPISGAAGVSDADGFHAFTVR